MLFELYKELRNLRRKSQQDFTCPGFAAECRRQAALVAEADRTDTDMQDFMNAALADLDDWQ